MSPVGLQQQALFERFTSVLEMFEHVLPGLIGGAGLQCGENLAVLVERGLMSAACHRVQDEILPNMGQHAQRLGQRGDQRIAGRLQYGSMKQPFDINDLAMQLPEFARRGLGRDANLQRCVPPTGIGQNLQLRFGDSLSGPRGGIGFDQFAQIAQVVELFRRQCPDIGATLRAALHQPGFFQLIEGVLDQRGADADFSREFPPGEFSARFEFATDELAVNVFVGGVQPSDVGHADTLIKDFQVRAGAAAKFAHAYRNIAGLILPAA